MKKTITLEIEARKPFLDIEMIAVYLKEGKLVALSKISQGKSANRLPCRVEPLFASMTVELPQLSKYQLAIKYPVYHIVIGGGLAKSPDENKKFKAINDMSLISKSLEKALCLPPVAPDVVLNEEHEPFSPKM